MGPFVSPSARGVSSRFYSGFVPAIKMFSRGCYKFRCDFKRARVKNVTSSGWSSRSPSRKLFFHSYFDYLSCFSLFFFFCIFPSRAMRLLKSREARFPKRGHNRRELLLRGFHGVSRHIVRARCVRSPRALFISRTATRVRAR